MRSFAMPSRRVSKALETRFSNDTVELFSKRKEGFFAFYKKKMLKGLLNLWLWGFANGLAEAPTEVNSTEHKRLCNVFLPGSLAVSIGVLEIKS